MNRCIKKSYTKSETIKPTTYSENGSYSSVNCYKCVSLYLFIFFHSYKFPLHNYFMSFVAKRQNRTLAFLSQLDYDQDGRGSSEVNLEVQWNLSITKEGQETSSICSLYNEVSFIEILFHIFYYNSGKKTLQLLVSRNSSYRGPTTIKQTKPLHRGTDN